MPCTMRPVSSSAASRLISRRVCQGKALSAVQSAFLHKVRAGGSMYGAIDSATAQQ
ncbi:hypothetical protein D9M68_577290 [compost metagenome]|uniref:Uncharacterized protein n=1 Tax=Achromobacter agilis TaxID=1353888 RepID=A0A446CE84_9BURK|nr:hypothetical protein AGI3411_02472 [Achromobacter agilis]